MGDQHDDATRQVYFLAQLETDDDREWNSLHLTYEDAERHRRWLLPGASGSPLTANPLMGFGVMPSRKSRCSDRTSPLAVSST